MVRKESEKDTDRPRYYSQFWLDIAAGRKTIGATKTGDEADIIEPEIEEPVTRRSGRGGIAASTSRYEPIIMHPAVEPEEEEEEFEAEQPVEMDMAEDEIGEADIPNILVEDIGETEDNAGFVPEEPEAEAEEPVSLEEEDEDFYDENEEEEEDGDWSGRGRKKPKGRQTRLPTSSKKPKRDRRTGF